MKEYLERPDLVSEYEKKETKKQPLKVYRVPVWISGVYDFLVEASDVEEAGELVRDGEVAIDYNRLKKEVYWDFGTIDENDIEVYEEDK